MMTGEPWDALETSLAGLRVYDAEPERVDRIRARSLAALAARRRANAARDARVAAWRRRLEPAFVLGLSAGYLAVALWTSLGLHR